MVKLLCKLGDLADAAGQMDCAAVNVPDRAGRLDFVAWKILHEVARDLPHVTDEADFAGLLDLLEDAEACIRGAELLATSNSERQDAHAVILDTLEAVAKLEDDWAFPHDALLALCDGIPRFAGAGARPAAKPQASVTAGVPKPLADVTAETELMAGGELAHDIVMSCSYDVEAVADSVIVWADSLERVPAAVARCFGMRIRKLNSVLMSYLDKDSITVRDAHQVLYCGAHALPEGPLAHRLAGVSA